MCGSELWTKLARIGLLVDSFYADTGITTNCRQAGNRNTPAVKTPFGTINVFFTDNRLKVHPVRDGRIFELLCRVFPPYFRPTGANNWHKGRVPQAVARHEQQIVWRRTQQGNHLPEVTGAHRTTQPGPGEWQGA